MRSSRMNEIIALLKQQLTLGTRIWDLSSQQQKNLIEQIGGRAIASLTLQMESLLVQLAAVEKRQQAVLARSGEGTLAALLSRQPVSTERNLASQLLNRLQQQIAQIKILNERNRVLLERNRQFAAFSINVITQASAETTYVPPGNSGVQAAKRVKMFDKSI